MHVVLELLDEGQAAHVLHAVEPPTRARREKIEGTLAPGQSCRSRRALGERPRRPLGAPPRAKVLLTVLGGQDTYGAREFR